MYPSEKSSPPGSSEYVADKPVGFVGLALFALCFLYSGWELGGRALGLRTGVNLGPGATTLEIIQWLLLLGVTLGCLGIALSLRWGFLLGASMPILWVLAYVIYFALYWDGLRIAMEAQVLEQASERGSIPSPSEREQIIGVVMMVVMIVLIVHAIIAISLSLYSLLRLSGVLGRKPS
jgi:small-conductance mechanosensitive channel